MPGLGYEYLLIIRTIFLIMILFKIVLNEKNELKLLSFSNPLKIILNNLSINITF